MQRDSLDRQRSRGHQGYDRLRRVLGFLPAADARSEPKIVESAALRLVGAGDPSLGASAADGALGAKNHRISARWRADPPLAAAAGGQSLDMQNGIDISARLKLQYVRGSSASLARPTPSEQLINASARLKAPVCPKRRFSARVRARLYSVQGARPKLCQSGPGRKA